MYNSNGGCMDVQQLAERFQSAVGQGGWGLPLLLCYAAGALTSLTPCVYPLIPITIGLFGARDPGTSRWKALGLAGAYVGGMALMYTALGLAAGLTGKQFGQFLGNPWLVAPVACFFVLMGLSMLGVFSMQLPQRLQRVVNNVGGRGVAGALLMGLVAGIVAAPCTGPILLALLGLVAKQGSVVKGGLFLLVYSLGLGTLFLLVALFSMKLPRSGVWMERIKAGLGVVLLFVALYVLKGAFPILERYGVRRHWFLGLHVGLVLVGILLGALTLPFVRRRAAWLRKSIGVTAMTWGVFGVAQWVWSTPPIAWKKDASAMAQAKAEHRPLLIDFSATWCLPCKKMEIETFGNPEVQRELQRFVLWKVDCSKDCESVQETYQMPAAIPGVVIVDSMGQVRHRINRAISAKELLPLLKDVQ